MPEEPATPPTPPAAPPANPPAPEQDPTDWKAEAEKWKSWSRTHEQRAKENLADAEKFRQAEDAKKPEIERLTGQVQSLNDENAKLRRAVAVTSSGLDESLVEFITATDEAGIKAQVERLKGSLKPSEPAPPAPPVPDGSAGYQGPPGDKSKGTEATGAELYKARKNR